jgi:hypothetical protein
MPIGLGKAVGGCKIGGEDSRSWFEISITLCIISYILNISSLFKYDFMDGRCICNVSDIWQVWAMSF